MFVLKISIFFEMKFNYLQNQFIALISYSFLTMFMLTYQQLEFIIICDNHMNVSNSYSDYQFTYSVNRSMNLSPTSGKLHKQREKGSFGPTICLLNRSREKIQENTAIMDSTQQDYLGKILMLMLEIQRLGQIVRKQSKQKQEWDSLQRLSNNSVLREQNQRLRMSVIRYETMQTEQERRYQSEILGLKQKISGYDAEIRTLNRKLRENQKDMQELQLRGKVNQSIAERAKMQASRMEMSMHFNSTNVDMHKSIVREKAMEIDLLRDKVIKCEDIINDQKFLINGQKDELMKQRTKIVQTENKYELQLEYLRKQLQFTQRQLSKNSQQESKRYIQQIREWQSRSGQVENQLKDKCMIIANQVKTISELDDKSLDLQRKLNDMEFTCHSRVTRAEQASKLAIKQKQKDSKKYNKQIHKLTEQIQSLKALVQQYKHVLAQKSNEYHQSALQMTNKLQQRDTKVKKMRRMKEQQSQTKLNKSMSVDNSIVTNRLRASQVNLQQIVTSVMQLKNSNDRTTKLIGKTFTAAKDIYYAK